MTYTNRESVIVKKDKKEIVSQLILVTMQMLMIRIFLLILRTWEFKKF